MLHIEHRATFAPVCLYMFLLCAHACLGSMRHAHFQPWYLLAHWLLAVQSLLLLLAAPPSHAWQIKPGTQHHNHNDTTMWRWWHLWGGDVSSHPSIHERDKSTLTEDVAPCVLAYESSRLLCMLVQLQDELLNHSGKPLRDRQKLVLAMVSLGCRVLGEPSQHLRLGGVRPH